MDLGARDALLFRRGQHGADLDQRLHRRARHCRAPEGLHEAGARHQRHDLVAREHQGRQVEAFAQDVADAGLALDRHAGALEVGDVAVDRALRHFQAPPELPRGDQAAAAQVLDDPEQAVGAAHRYRLNTPKLLPSGSRQ